MEKTTDEKALVLGLFRHIGKREAFMNRQLKELEQRTGYEFQNKKLLHQAMTHSSYANEHHMDKSKCNERLEFLGDAVLEVVSSDFLYHKYKRLPEGDLTKLRASIVCEPTLALCAGEKGRRPQGEESEIPLSPMPWKR